MKISWYAKTWLFILFSLQGVSYAGFSRVKPLSLPPLPTSRHEHVTSMQELKEITALKSEIRYAKENRCIESLCGDAAQNFTSTDTLQERLATPARNYSQTWDRQFASRVKSSIERRREIDLKLARRIADIYEGDFVLDRRHPYLVFYHYHKALPYLDSAIKAVVKDASGEFVISDKLLEDSLASVSAPLKAVVRLLAHRYVLPRYRAWAVASASPGMPYQMLRAITKYPTLSYTEGMKKDTADILANVAGLKALLGENLVASFLNPQEQRLITETLKGLLPDKQRELTLVLDKVDIYALLGLDPEIREALLALPSLELEEKIAAYKSENRAQQRLFKLAQQVGPEKDFLLADGLCRVKISAMLEASASQWRIERAKKMFEEVRQAALVVAQRLAPEERHRDLQAFGMSTRMGLPPTIKEKLAHIENALAQEEENIKTSFSLLEDQSADMNLLFVLRALEDASTDSSKMDWISFCGSLRAQVITDRASGNSIETSWFSAAYPQVGVGIIAHEIGHLYSMFFTAQIRVNPSAYPRYQEKMACVDQRNIAGPGGTFQEEDFADHFSALVMNELKLRQSSWYSNKNMACSLVWDKGDFYVGSLQALKNVSHSSGLFRLLMTAHDRGLLTPECQSVMASLPAKNSLSCGK